MDPSRASYLAPIDGIRAFAVGAVLLFHLGHLSGGFLGVDAFFVVSGFLITRQLLIEVERTDRISLVEFWSRRARRLLPALVLVLVIVVVLASRYGRLGERATVAADAPWALSFLTNWHHIGAASDYWTSLAMPSPFTHLWSLAVEEQFYLLWPLVAAVLMRRSARRDVRVFLGAGVGMVASFVLMAALFEPSSTTRVYEGTDTRLGGLMIGALCATAIVRRRSDAIARRLGRRLDLVVAAAVVGLAWMWCRVDGRDSWLYRGGFLLHAALVAAVLVLVTSVVTMSSDSSGVVARILSTRGLRWFGRLSYGLYLWHWPVYIALDPGRTGLSRWPLTVVRLGATLVVATVSFYAVEQPARQALQHRPLRSTAAMGTAVALLAGLVIALAPQPDLRPAPIDIASLSAPSSPVTTAPVAATPVTATPVTATTLTTTTVTPTAVTPTTGLRAVGPSRDVDLTPIPLEAALLDGVPQGTAPASTAPLLPALHQVLWLGDSIASTEAPATGAALAAIGIPFYDGAFVGVGMLNSTGLVFFQRLDDEVNQLHPDLVIMQMSTWDEPYGADAIYDALGLVRDRVVSGGGRLLLLPVPPLRSDRDSSDGGGYGNDAIAAQRLTAADPLHVSFLPVSPVWGTTFDADLDDDGVPERMGDGVHVCPAGAARLAIYLITQLADRFAGLTVADPATWATGAWAADPRYNGALGGCSLLDH